MQPFYLDSFLFLLELLVTPLLSPVVCLAFHTPDKLTQLIESPPSQELKPPNKVKNSSFFLPSSSDTRMKEDISFHEDILSKCFLLIQSSWNGCSPGLSVTRILSPLLFKDLLSLSPSKENPAPGSSASLSWLTSAP